MSSKVTTVKVVDPRIEPQPAPVYSTSISPAQNQYYKLPASGLSNTYVTFNNLTTLGADRAYLDTFELEITADFTFNFTNPTSDPLTMPLDFITFDSFPFNKCAEQITVNTNGGAIFSNPMIYLRQKERYWDEKKLNDAYGNVCPCNKPYLDNELGMRPVATSNAISVGHVMDIAQHTPTRLFDFGRGYALTSTGPNGSRNNDIIDLPDEKWTLPAGASSQTLRVTWREPILASPFASRIDENYGKPLYAITSIDIAFNMQDLTNMLRVAGLAMMTSYSVNLASVNLCYQVCTLPAGFTPPPSTVVPYRRYVPYVTNVPAFTFDDTRVNRITATSGVYTLNEIPTAIWIYLGPTKALLQTNPVDGYTGAGGASVPTWTWNKLAYPMEHISISMANTTQILNTATPLDLYRIAKANGCQDPFTSYYRDHMHNPATATYPGEVYTRGAGSVLRLIPGTDIVIPDQELIPGANANNIVFQVTADFNIPPDVPPGYRDFALWILFEYVGVITITPGQCEIDMNPLGKGAAMKSAPVVSSDAIAGEPPASTTEGSGWLENLNDMAKRTGLVGSLLGMVPGVGGLLKTGARMLGYGDKMGKKRPRDEVKGGAVLGLGDFV